MDNIFTPPPGGLTEEITDILLARGRLRIERIVSKGHTSPASGWYEQHEHEWVIVLQGSGTLVFEDGRRITLEPGDYLNIAAGARHKVSWTDPDETTVWLAIFYR